jgi:methylated-DNA-protein-cysteine methyltransferase-like protein
MRDALFELVRRIPRGKATSYGAIGAALEPPISGFLVGRAMRNCPEDVPWWRVVAKDGSFPTNKLSPDIANDQLRLLKKEKVPIEDLRVARKAILSPDELIALTQD